MTTINYELVGSHLAFDLIKCRDNIEGRRDLMLAVNDAIDERGGNPAVVFAHAAIMLARFTDDAHHNPGGEQHMLEAVNHVVCQVAPRPDWMPDPYGFDLSQLEGA